MKEIILLLIINGMYCVDLTCHPLPIVEHGYAIDINTVVGHTSTIMCSTGYRTNKGFTSQQVSCLHGGKYSTLSRCISKTLHNLNSIDV